MQPQLYSDMSDLELLSLCVWREARGEGLLGKRGVAHVVKNRSDQPGWWGQTFIKAVILKPDPIFQFQPRRPERGKMAGG